MVSTIEGNSWELISFPDFEANSLTPFQNQSSRTAAQLYELLQNQLVQEIQKKCFWNSLLRLNANHIRSRKRSTSFFYWCLSNVTEKREDFECVIVSLKTSSAGLCYATYITYMLTTEVLLQHNLHRYYNEDIVILWDQIYVCLRHLKKIF